MIKTFILIIIFSGDDFGSISFQEFNTLKACKSAKAFIDQKINIRSETFTNSLTKCVGK